MSGFMTTVNKLEKSKGLDLILHTPGGEINATEQIVFYLRKIFNGDIRAIVPHLAMSAGTMIALACKSIVMGLHSNLGPIDPQVGNGAAAHAILEEFKGIRELFGSDPKQAQAWLPILQKYTPTLIGACEKAITLSETMVKSWLISGMLAASPDPETAASKVIDALGRHITIEQAQNLGLTIDSLETDHDLQNAVLSVHHSYIVTFSMSPAVSIIENHLGKRFVNAQINLPQGIPFMLDPQQVPHQNS
jgi:hypothetical protein